MIIVVDSCILCNNFLLDSPSFSIDNPTFEIEDSDWNDHYVLAYEINNVIAAISFLYNSKKENVVSCEIRELQLYC